MKPLEKPEEINDECWGVIRNMIQINSKERWSAFSVLNYPLFKPLMEKYKEGYYFINIYKVFIYFNYLTQL
jgi:serine/threonine protein kinase